MAIYSVDKFKDIYIAYSIEKGYDEGQWRPLAGTASASYIKCKEHLRMKRENAELGDNFLILRVGTDGLTVMFRTDGDAAVSRISQKGFTGDIN